MLWRRCAKAHWRSASKERILLPSVALLASTLSMGIAKWRTGIEKKSVAKLQDARTVRKIVKIDEHICLAFAGLVADARVLINKARVHALSTQLSLDERISVDALTKYVAGRLRSTMAAPIV